MQTPKLAKQELRRCMTELGFAGVQVRACRRGAKGSGLVGRSPNNALSGPPDRLPRQRLDAGQGGLV